MKEVVQAALADINTAYGKGVRVVPDEQGGAWIEIPEVDLGATYREPASFVICLLPFNLPNADVYPLFVRHDLARADGSGLGEGFAATPLSWPGEPNQRPVIQVSRRTRRSDFTRQTALQKIDKVLDWIRTR